MYTLISNLDQAVYAWFYGIRTETGIVFFTYLTQIGSTEAIIIFALIFVIYLYSRGKSKQAGVFIIGLLTNTIVVYGLKSFVHRPRNLLSVVSETTTSFPSGHTAATIFFFGFVLYYTTKSLPHGFWRAMVRTVCVLLVILIPSSRLYLGAHYFTDILASVCIASTVLFITVKQWEKASVQAQK